MYFVDFKDGEVILSQKRDGKTLTLKLPTSVVRRVNPILERVGLPNVYQWVGMGLNLQLLMRLFYSVIALSLLDPNEHTDIYNRASEILTQTDKDLTGCNTLGSSIYQIQVDWINACNPDTAQMERSQDEFARNWDFIHDELMGL